LFCHAAAAFLGIDIYLTSDTSTRENPFIYLTKSWTMGQENITSLHPMLIGSISQHHFQSLVYSIAGNANNVHFSVEGKLPCSPKKTTERFYVAPGTTTSPEQTMSCMLRGTLALLKILLEKERLMNHLKIS